MRAVDVVLSDVPIVRPMANLFRANFGSRDVTGQRRARAPLGLVGSAAERKALRALAESVPDVTRVCDETIPAY
jgi:hypothetical protein